MTSDLTGRVAVVTGAARGIGRASAVALARAGADVAGLDIAGPVAGSLEVVPASPQDLSRTGELVEQAGRRWSAQVVDQRDITALRAAADAIRTAYGGIDIVHANAGIQAFAPLLTMSEADWHDQI